MQSRAAFYALVYGITTVVFFLIDLIWIGIVASDFYARTIGDLLAESVNWGAALLFYPMYIGGIVFFVLVPAIEQGASIRRTALAGGLLGLFAYGTFDLTALALLDGWPVIVTIVDMMWGTCLTAATATGALLCSRMLMRFSGPAK